MVLYQHKTECTTVQTSDAIHFPTNYNPNVPKRSLRCTIGRSCSHLRPILPDLRGAR
ncbi:hypothetical protein M378DRAFT_163204 [Amanita muscaria Koide BX008]|uniref:Uncharacterized protein n=1 Tax=Amanita muscaria (strain Koide BX008) TaxID=946122 RepID=A0A0C2X594_AMAMK|nr:hypothetical protein M378DRAFT_163204 [Amanita muscaria Koide BX008]